MKPLLLIIAIWLLIAPYPSGPPHLLEKITWLQTGQSLAAIDWFDIALHGGLPPTIIGFVLFNLFKKRTIESDSL